MEKNNVEVEYKFQISSEELEKFSKKLDGMCESKKDKEYQENVMFDNSEGVMRKTNGRIRVRTLGRAGMKLLTYKKPVSSKNGAKREIEFEVTVDDSKNFLEKIFEMMGYLPVTSYERYQVRWEIGSVHVTIDEYPYANYMEIEGNYKKIKSLVKELGLETEKALTKPADTLFQEWRKERGLDFKAHMRFADFDR